MPYGALGACPATKMRLHPLRVTTILCCAGFDATLQDLLRDARSVGPQAAVSRWAGALDATFLPTLSTQLDAAADRGEEARCAELMGLMEAVEQACAAERAVDACMLADSIARDLPFVPAEDALDEALTTAKNEAEVDKAMKQALADGARPGCPAIDNAEKQLKAIAKAAKVDACIASHWGAPC